MEVNDHLFRREAGRMVAALTHIFGVHNLDLAEDVVQDAFCRAEETWKMRGPPENPPAWLMQTAKNRALDVLRRERTARRFAPELGRLLQSEWTLVPTVEELFEPSAIKDDQLRMMFSCCNPQLPEPVQIALTLYLMCGFSTHEIASAFVVSKAAVEKRIARGKKALAQSERLFDISSDAELSARLSAVQRALYLLFNEGYHSASPERSTRVELCHEAMRLTALLIEYVPSSTPATLALAALMCFDAARLPARTDAIGNLNTLSVQDRSLWDASLIAEGKALLERSAQGDVVSEYHVEAAIASIHATAREFDDTDWDQIVALYDTLLCMRPSPVVALNRAIAVAQRDGPQRGLEAIATIDAQSLASYPFYFAALGEMEFRRGNRARAAVHFAHAGTLARNSAERRFLEQRVAACR